MSKYFIDLETGQRARIDNAGNCFIGKKCVNAKVEDALTVAESAELFEGFCEVELQRSNNKPVITGHVTAFEYTEYDDQGKPYKIKVNTCQPAW